MDIPPDTWLEPDLFYVSNETKAHLKDRPRSTADLVTEVLSPGSADYDRRTKADTYAALGIKELWLVDPDTHTVEVRISTGKTWGTPQLLHVTDELTCSVIPGLKIAVAVIFAE